MIASTWDEYFAEEQRKEDAYNRGCDRDCGGADDCPICNPDMEDESDD